MVYCPNEFAITFIYNKKMKEIYNIIFQAALGSVTNDELIEKY